jgi:hypothetical protein
LEELGKGANAVAGIKAETVIVRAPVALVGSAAVVLGLSVILLVPRAFAPSLIGYLLAPLAVTFLVSVFRYRDARASQSPFYSTNAMAMRAGTWLVVISFVVGLAHAWVLATYIAKWIGS